MVDKVHNTYSIDSCSHCDAIWTFIFVSLKKKQKKNTLFELKQCLRGTNTKNTMTAFEGGTGRENQTQEEACVVVAGDLTSVSHFNKELDLL